MKSRYRQPIYLFFEAPSRRKRTCAFPFLFSKVARNDQRGTEGFTGAVYMEDRHSDCFLTNIHLPKRPSSVANRACTKVVDTRQKLVTGLRLKVAGYLIPWMGRSCLSLTQ